MATSWTHQARWQRLLNRRRHCLRQSTSTSGVGEHRMRSWLISQWILTGQQTFRSASVTLSFSVFLESVTYRNRSIAQKLTVHRFHARVRSFECGKTDESVAFRVSGIWIAHDSRCFENDAER